MSPSSPAFSGSLSLSTTQGGCTATNGANNSSFAISGSNLVTNGTVAPGTYAVCILATQAGATNSPFGQAATITGSSQSIASIFLSNPSFNPNVSNATVGTISVAMSPASPAFSGTLSLSSTAGGCNSTNGANNTSFRIAGNTLETNGSVAAGTYAVCILATETSASNNPVGQSETLTGSSTTAEEEFVGPFASWTQLNCPASPTDSTACWQSAINALSTTHPVLYVPAKTYSISGTLAVDPSHISAINPPQYITIVGADPATTQIVWNGTSGGTMIRVDAVGYSRLFSRITLNGNGLAAIAMNQSCSTPNCNIGQFDESNEYADTVLENAQYGMQCGTAGNGCADNQMIRDKFLGNSIDGLLVGNFNALVWECFYCTITNNAHGLTNDPGGAGGFHVFNSLFQNNSVGDVGIGNTTTFSFVGNYSSGSAQFLVGGGSNSSVANILMANNTIVDTTQNTAIDVSPVGPLTLVNNLIKNAGGTPVVNVRGNIASDLLSVGNTFTAGTVSSTGGCGTAITVSNSGSCHEVNDQKNTNPTIPPVPTLGFAVPQNQNRTICDTSAQTQAAIQTAMTCAINSVTTKPIVHIPAGTYSISSTLTVPACPNAGCDMQIVGDGYFTQLNAASGLGSNPIFTLTGPSKATLNELALNGNNNQANGILITNADQVGARVYIEGMLAPQNTSAIFSDNLNNTLVEAHGIYAFYRSVIGSSNTFRVVGSGSTAAGATRIFGGTNSGSYYVYGISGDAHFTDIASWTDRGGVDNSCAMVNLTGSGTFTMGGGVGFIGNSAGCNGANTIIRNFTGIAGLFSEDLSESDTGSGACCGSIAVSGTGTGGQDLIAGWTSNASTYYSHTATGDTSAFLDPYYYNGAWNSLAETPSSFTCPGTTCTLITNATAQLEGTAPTLRTALASGVTDVYIHRVYVDSAINAVHVQH
jgi:hypothetical protein